MDTMVSMILNGTGFAAGDVLPLRVQLPAFTAFLSQSTTFPGQLNTIYITLIPNIDCADSVSIIEGEASHIEFSSITITGLVGSETATNSELPLGGAGADIFGRNGSWDQISGTLMLANPWRGPVVRTAVALAVYSCLRRVCKHRLART